jgi:hypothetical protein
MVKENEIVVEVSGRGSQNDKCHSQAEVIEDVHGEEF